MKGKVRRTERGWAGHFCAAKGCLFRRNTLLELGKKKIIVSTVGDYQSAGPNGKTETIGLDRYYETMVFKAKFESPYWEADVSHEVPFESNWRIDDMKRDADLRANKMHEAVVAEITKKMKGE